MKFADLLNLRAPCRSTLGGTGLAISAACRHASRRGIRLRTWPGRCQRGLFFQSGGQPAHRTAWLDPAVNAACQNYFRDTLPALERAFLRPRYPGHMAFQDRAGTPIQDFLRHGGDTRRVLDQLDLLYRQSLPEGAA